MHNSRTSIDLSSPNSRKFWIQVLIDLCCFFPAFFGGFALAVIAVYVLDLLMGETFIVWFAAVRLAFLVSSFVVIWVGSWAMGVRVASRLRKRLNVEHFWETPETEPHDGNDEALEDGDSRFSR